MILRLSPRAALDLAQGFQDRWVRGELEDGRLRRATILLHKQVLPVEIVHEWGEEVVKGELEAVTA